MTDFKTIDYFTDEATTLYPYDFYSLLHENDARVWVEPKHGVALVTGYDEAMAVLRDPATFSSCNLVAGPTPSFPVAFEGDDITETVELYRDGLPQSDQIVTFDPPKHTAHRALLMGLITPKRLKENEDFIWRLADRQLDVILPLGKAEFINDFGQAYALLVVADLLGVPEADHEPLLNRMGRGMVGNPIPEPDPETLHSLSPLYDYFIGKIEELRKAPQNDILTGMATATFPDGTVPEPIEVARIASNLFAAGQETTVRLMGTALQRICEDPELQQKLRDNRDLLPKFIEEVMRTEGPIKGEFRLTRKRTTLGGVDLAAGTVIMLLNGAANRDPRQFENPQEFWIERPNVRRHLGFGLGIHTCPGAPLARSEVRISIERLFDRTSNIRISEEEHGPPGARRYTYMPTYMFRGVTKLFLEFTP